MKLFFCLLFCAASILYLGYFFIFYSQTNSVDLNTNLTSVASSTEVITVKEGQYAMPIRNPFLPRGYHVESSDVYYFDRLIPNVDVTTFVVLDQYYAKDKNSVFLFGSIFEAVDPATFRIEKYDTDVLVKDKNNIYNYTTKEPIDVDINIKEARPIGYAVVKDSKNVFYTNFDSNEKFRIEVADPETFVLIGPCASVEKSAAYYYKDKYHVYVAGKVIPEIDVSSFQFLGNFNNPDGGMLFSTSYAKDKNNVYVGCGQIANEVDVGTFMVLNNGFAEDKDHILSMGKAIEGLDKKTYTKIDDAYSRDKNKVYLYGYPLSVDVSTWQKLDGFYSADKDNVYLSFEKTGADRKTFKVLSHGYTQDKNGIYAAGDRLNLLSTSTFHVLESRYATDGKRMYYAGCFDSWDIKYADVASFEIVSAQDDYAKDKNYVYHECSKVQGVDPKTFANLGFGYGKDKNGIYDIRGGSRIVGVDAETFKVVDQYTQEDKNFIYKDGAATVKK